MFCILFIRLLYFTNYCHSKQTKNLKEKTNILIRKQKLGFFHFETKKHVVACLVLILLMMVIKYKRLIPMINKMESPKGRKIVEQK